MIGKLKGRIDEVNDDSALIDVGGVGYIAFCSSRTLATLSPHEAAELVIETHVREDHIHLYGFANSAERDWFRLLTSVQRVGAKMALSILGAYGPPQLAQIILARDIAALSRVSGVGAKLAERIVTELKDKTASMTTGPVTLAGNKMPKGKKSAKAVPYAATASEDAISALVNLGYTRSEAYAAVIRAGGDLESEVHVDDLIKLALKDMASGVLR